jgi:hypothetical protein
MRKGNIEELRTAEAERIEITLLKKDFSGEILNKIKLENSLISKCNFVESSFYGNEYTNCEFISCDFSKSNMLNVKFINCRFHETKFDECQLEDIIFDDCKVINCSFKNTDLSANVQGLNEKDINVITEDTDYSKITEMGFEQTDKNEFVIKSNDEFCELCVVKDDELGENDWRTIFFAKDESLLSDTFEIFEEINLGEISRNIQGLLIDVKTKMKRGGYDDFLSDEDKNKVVIGLEDIKSKFKRVYNSED